MHELKTQQTVSCSRCGKPCKVAQQNNQDARLLRHATTPSGYCANCAATAFIKSMDVFMASIEQHGPQKILSWQPWRDGFGGLLKAGNADARPEEIDWDVVLENWDLPFPKPPRQKKTKKVEAA